MSKYFGTDGIRGTYGVSLFDFMAYRIGRFLGGDGFSSPKKILLSRDTRASGVPLSEALIKGVIESGGTIYDLGVSSTPSVSYLVQNKDFDFGVMISASHNPFRDNGIKVFNSLGEKLSSEIEEKIEEYIDLEILDAPKENGKRIDGASLKQEYLSWLKAKADPKIQGIEVLADLANGSATGLAPELFASLGLKTHFLGNEPTGENINENCGSTHMENLAKEFKDSKVSLAFAFDGDADRFLAIARNGRLIDGDAQIFLSALALRQEGKLKGNKVVITVMANYGLRKVLEKEGIPYEIVPVGDKYVQAKLKEENLVLGGEQSGHVIYLNHLNTGDGLLSAIMLLNLYAKHPEIYAKLDEFIVYPQVLKNIRFENRTRLNQVMEDASIKKAIALAEEKLGSSGRILVRPSGTEPLLRVMVEALDERLCAETVDNVIKAVKEVL